MGHFKRSISYLTRLLAEDRPQQTLLCRQLRLSLRSHFAHQDISCPHFRSDTDNSSLVQILKGIVADARNIPGNLFRSQLGITRFRLVFFYMNRCIYIFLHQSLA